MLSKCEANNEDKALKKLPNQFSRPFLSKSPIALQNLSYNRTSRNRRLIISLLLNIVCSKIVSFVLQISKH